MTNFKNAEIGTLAEIGEKYENGKAFLHDLLELTSCEISVNAMTAGLKIPFCHRHFQNEEIYIFLKGEGTITIDNKVIDVKEGSCVKIMPKAARTIEAKTDMQYLCVQAKTNSLEQFGLKDAELC
jgi:mannose-6-phosphate isomerase-like protein (cupin superfamily)